MKLKLLLPLVAALGLLALPASAQITAAQLTAGSVTMPKINQSGATSGQVIEWSGSAWQPFTLTSSGGTVTSVALSMPSIFSVSGSPVTTSGTLTGSLTTESANKVFSGPSSGSAASPTFRSLVAADVPSLAASILTSGTVATARLGSGMASSSTFLRGDQTWATPSIPANLATMTLSGTSITSTTGGIHYYTGATNSLTLPNPSSCTGYSYTFVDNGTSGTIYDVTQYGTEKINGSTSAYVLNFINQSVTLVSDGINWWITASGAPVDLFAGITVTDGTAVTPSSGTVVIGSQSFCGIIGYTSASSGVAGTICSVIFSFNLGSQPAIAITPTTVDSAKAGFYISAETTSGFTVSNAYAPASSVPLGFTYTISQL